MIRSPRLRAGGTLTAGLVLAAGLAGCWPDRLVGKACDYEHPCFDGYRCIEGSCLVDDGSFDPDPDPPPEDAGAPQPDDAGPDRADAGLDAGEADAGPHDGGVVEDPADSGLLDAGATDGG